MLLITRAYAYEIPDAFLEKLAQIESDNNHKAVGDKKKALGMFQLHKSAWDDACSRNGVSWAFNRKNAFNETRSKIVARWHLEWLAERLIANGYEVTPMRLYMCYNLGIKGALKLKLKPNNLPSLIRAERILNSYESNRQETKLNKSHSIYDGMHSGRT